MKKRLVEIFFLSAISLITLGFHLYDLGLPPLWPDEATFFLSGLTLTNPVDTDLYSFGSQFAWRYEQFPVAWAPYFGALSSYVSSPVHYFMGSTVEAIRIYSAITSISIVILLYFASKELFSYRVGIISSTLFTFFPLFVFWSRQSIAYEWILISILLVMIIFMMRFFKTHKYRYLCITLFFVGIGVWGYLWFAFAILAAIILLPLWYRPLKKICIEYSQNNSSHPSRHRYKLVIFGSISFIVGLIPLIVHFIIAKNASLIPFIVVTLLRDSFYKPAHVEISNVNFVDNFHLRIQNFFGILTEPGNSLSIANLSEPWSSPSYVILGLFIISLIFLINHILKKKEHYKIIVGLLLFFPIILVASSFTVSAFHVMQIGLIIPFIFIVIGKFIEIAITNNNVKKIISKYKLKLDHLMALIIIGIVLTQIGIIVEGFNVLENSKTASVHVVYENLSDYLNKNKLIPVTFDFFTHKGFLFNTNGEHIPLVIHGIWEAPEFNDKVRKSMENAESLGVVDKKYLFIIYSYPQLKQCDTDSNSGGWSNQCAQFYFVESAAERNELKLETIDFNLPDGTPYLRAIKFVD